MNAENQTDARNPRFEVMPFSTPDELAQAAAKFWLDDIEAALRPDKLFYGVAVSGGRIAAKLFASMAEQASERALPLRNVHFFWADERCVGPGDPESNYRLAREHLFEPLGIRERQIHRIEGELDPDEAAARAATELSRQATVFRNGQPSLDLVLLGMGEDGHVASLFPNQSEELLAQPAVFRAVRNSPKPPPDRVTLGLPAIAVAQKVWVVVSGSGKEQAFRESLAGPATTPLGRVLTARGYTRIFSDIPLGGS